jgi:hypothetical protein
VPEKLRCGLKKNGSGQRSAKRTRESPTSRKSERKRAEATARERKTMEKLKELRLTMEGQGGLGLGRDVSNKLPDADTANTALIIGLSVAVTRCAGGSGGRCFRR